MALELYTDRYVFPNGAVAANTPARVFKTDVSGLAPLFTDGTGTTPLPNPLNTNGSGVLTFWAEAGDYWIHIDSETFPVTVGMSEEAADLSTGVASGGRLTVNGSNPLAVDITAVDGYIVNYLADNQATPIVTRVKKAAQTVPLDAAALLRTATWFLMDTAGNVVQQATPPSNVQRRTHLNLGAAAQDGVQIFSITPNTNILAQPVNQLADLMDALGLFAVQNVIATPNANLTFSTNATTLFARSLNRYSGGSLTNNPHTVSAPAASPAQFRYITRNATTFGPLRTTVDVANYDVGGVVTPLGGGSNTASIHRLYLAGTGNAADQFAFQYGQTAYPSLSAATAAMGKGLFTVNPILTGATTFVVWIAAIRTATNLSDPAQATIVSAGKFAAP